MEDIVELARQKRAEIDALKVHKAKKDGIEKAVKMLTKSEFDALPKVLQKELREFR